MTFLTQSQLEAIMPRCPPESLAQYGRWLVQAMGEQGVTTPMRMAAFLAQLAHESCELTHWLEDASGDAYEGRIDLGNTQPGDGRRYRGRGPIQLTGRANYREAGRALNIDLEAKPERAYWVDTGFRIAAWYWRSRGCNELADAGDFTTITRRINGGLNHQAQREAYYRRALEVLGEKGEAA